MGSLSSSRSLFARLSSPNETDGNDSQDKRHSTVQRPFYDRLLVRVEGSSTFQVNPTPLGIAAGGLGNNNVVGFLITFLNPLLSRCNTLLTQSDCQSQKKHNPCNCEMGIVALLSRYYTSSMSLWTNDSNIKYI